jgi:hypothetical protein
MLPSQKARARALGRVQWGPTRSMPRSSPRARANVAQASWRLGYHIHDHRRVGATGAVVLMEPSNGQVTGHWAVCSAVSSCMVVGPCTVHVLSESTHLPLALPGAHAGSVMVSLNLESRVLVNHKMGPAFSHFVVSEGAFLSAFVVYAVHLRAVHMALFRPAGPRDVVCSRNISPCSGVYAPSPDDVGADGPQCRGTQTQGNFQNTLMTTTWGERDKPRQTAAAKHDSTNMQHMPCRSS